VQVAAVDVSSDAGLQVRDLIAGSVFPGPVTVPPVAVTGIKNPAGDAAIAPVILKVVEIAAGAIITFSTAMVPFGIAVAFIP
jgi:hypothetical protein